MSVVSALHELGFNRKAIAALTTRAKVRGKSPKDYLKGLIEADLDIDQILAPVREGFARSGMTEGELDAIVAKARKQYHRPKRKSAKR